MESIRCKNCDGEMEVTVKPKHNQGFGFFLILLGLIFILLGLPFGILCIAIGFYICIAKESMWLCKACRVGIPRVED